MNRILVVVFVKMHFGHASNLRIGYPYHLTSKMAKQIAAHQANCNINYSLYTMNHAGLGSDLHVWGQTLCHGMELNQRLKTHDHWQWADEIRCNTSKSLNAYFKVSIPVCDTAKVLPAIKQRGHCHSIINNLQSMRMFRAATTEYLFSNGLTDCVMREVRQQIFEVFKQPFVPPHLITVHIRWGDKASEMDLPNIDEYIKAVFNLLDQRNTTKQVNIFVATEDPLAIELFKRNADPSWNIYSDVMVTKMRQYRPKTGNHALRTTQKSHGYAGLIAIASLVISMEANEFVLTTKSNWSRMMNELRTNVVDPKCNYCTKIIDLRRSENGD